MWPGGTQEPFKVKTGDHVLHLSIAIVAPEFRVKSLIARRQNDRPNFYFDLLRLLMKIYGVMLTDSLADRTFLVFKEKTVFVYISDKGNGLREVYMDGFIGRQVLVERIRDRDRAILYTDSTTGAFVLYNVSGLFNQGYLEVSCFSFYTVNFSIGQDLYIGMPVTFNKLGRFDAHGAIIRGEGLIQLGHLAANGG